MVLVFDTLHPFRESSIKSIVTIINNDDDNNGFFFQVFVLIWRIVSFFMKNSVSFNDYVFKFTAFSRLNKLHLTTVLHNVSYGEWLFLKYLAGNMNGKMFNDLLAQLSDSFLRESVSEDDDKKILEKKIIEKEKPSSVQLLLDF